jgi:hypothetical protein
MIAIRAQWRAARISKNLPFRSINRVRSSAACD